jgi:hypothetical protein
MRKLIVPIVFALTLGLGGPVSHTFAGDCTKSQDPKCEVPEAPKPLGLPIAGVAVFGGYVWYLRRRQASVDEAS